MVVGAGIVLRPWQELVAERALLVEDGDDGRRLVWRTVVVSTPRQSGKSWLIKSMALARAAHPDLFGEPQTVVHVANRHLAARRIHSQAWGWAGLQGLDVRTAQGMERIIWPDGSSWDALTLSSVYGATAGLVMLDEVWDVSPEEYREGIRPTQVERSWPQLWALSTAHRRASELMGTLMDDGRVGRGRTMLADWGAREGDDFDDPRVWEAASPHWSAQRREEMDFARNTEGFAEQWLNVWPASGAGWIGSQAWAERRVRVPDGVVWVAAGVESLVGDDTTPVVALVARDGDRLLVSVRELGSMVEAAALVRRVPRVIVGASIAKDPAWRGRRVEPRSERATVSLTEFLRQFREADLVHDGGLVLTEQIHGIRLASQAGGMVRLASHGRIEAVKAASWAVGAARARRGSMIAVPRGVVT